MLADARRIAGQFSGIADVWRSPFATPNPTAVMGKSSVWFTAYPISMITKPGHSFLSTLVLTYGSSCVVRDWLVGGAPARRWDR
jgi:hypothetical protein